MSGPLNLANLLTVSRLALAPLVIRAILNGQHTQALALFALAAVTDVLDGAAARRWGLATKGGAYLDPVADKVLVSGVFLALAGANLVPWWFVAMVLGRDLYILLGASLLMTLTSLRNFPPSVWGKISTFFQIVTATTWMANDVLANRWIDLFAWMVLTISAALTLWSGLHYTWRGIRLAARIDGSGARE